MTEKFIIQSTPCTSLACQTRFASSGPVSKYTCTCKKCLCSVCDDTRIPPKVFQKLAAPLKADPTKEWLENRRFIRTGAICSCEDCLCDACDDPNVPPTVFQKEATSIKKENILFCKIRCDKKKQEKIKQKQ